MVLFVHVVIGNIGGHLRIRLIEMIKFLVKICTFFFSLTHLSFLLYYQQNPQEQQISVMSPTHERTYIMVKVWLPYSPSPCLRMCSWRGL
jgi:hypothetical protein